MGQESLNHSIFVIFVEKATLLYCWTYQEVCKSAVIEDWKKEREVAKYRYRVLCFYDKQRLRAKTISSSTNNNSKIPITILSDNGSEFHKEFEALIAEKRLEHLWTYPNVHSLR